MFPEQTTLTFSEHFGIFNHLLIFGGALDPLSNQPCLFQWLLNFALSAKIAWLKAGVRSRTHGEASCQMQR